MEIHPGSKLVRIVKIITTLDISSLKEFSKVSLVVNSMHCANCHKAYMLICYSILINLFIYLGFYIPFNTVQVIS